MDIRIIAFREGDLYTLLYVNHHDDAYAWAEKQAHGASASVPSFSLSQPSDLERGTQPNSLTAPLAPPRADDQSLGRRLASELASLNYPSPVVRLVEMCSCEDDVIDLASSLAPDYQEAILELATGGTPRRSAAPAELFVVADDDELRRALAFPFDEWRVFLHAAQRETIERTNERHLAIVGGPGTGKTVCLLHRAVRLARACGHDEAIALVFHSPAMVEEATRLLRTLVDPLLPALVVTDMIALGRRGNPQPTDIKRSDASEALFLHNRRLRALLIDEAQDLHRTTKEWIWKAPPMPRGTHISVALDPNQNLFARQPVERGLQRFVDRCDIGVLDYGYRLSHEIAEAATRFLAAFRREDVGEAPFKRLRERSDVVRFGFRGPPVRILSGDSAQQRAEILAGRVNWLASRNRAEDVAVIQFLNKAAWEAHPAAELDLGAQIRTPRSCKGLEFRSGVLFEPIVGTGSSNTDDKTWKLWSEVYVALTRFRDEVEVIVDSATGDRFAHSGVGVLT
jgi:hypothetical protein